MAPRGKKSTAAAAAAAAQPSAVQEVAPEVSVAPEIVAPEVVAKPAAAAAVVQSEAPLSSNIAQSVSKVPLVGGFAVLVLESRAFKPITSFADPYVDAGLAAATPYAKAALQRAQPLVDRAQPIVDRALPVIQALPGQVAAIPSQAIETAKATPAKVYSATVTTASSALTTFTSVPGLLYQGAMDRFNSSLQLVKALPDQVRSGVSKTSDNIVAAPGRACQSIVERGTPVFESAAKFAQPYVHKSIGFVTPLFESAISNRRVQSLSQSSFMQSGVEKVSPYLQSVVSHPRFKSVAEPVVNWARPQFEAQ